MEPARLALAAGLMVCALLATAHSLPPRRSRADGSDSFVAVGTNKIATSVLQSYVDVDANIAFSPLGVSALLAILAEGARGETRNQLVAALHLPADREETRAVYKTVLSRLKDKHTLNHPEFRNWFYIYKNYTVEQCFRDVLEENYLTEVRDVDSPHSEQSNDVATEEIVVHKPIRFEQTGVKVVLPAIPSEEEDESARPVKGEGLDANNLPADLDPISQVPVDASSLDEVHVTKVSQEDSIRTIMVQEAAAMQEALKVKDENKTVAFIREREEEIKKALEKDVVDKEQIKVAVEEQIQTEKEIQSAIADKMEKQEAIKEALETELVKEEEAIDSLTPADMIQVAVVVMNDDEVRRDGAVFKEEHVDFDREEQEDDEPLPPFKNVSIFDSIREDVLHIKEEATSATKEEAKPETGGAKEDNKQEHVSTVDHPAPDHTHVHPTMEEMVPTKIDQVTEESVKKEYLPEEAKPEIDGAEQETKEPPFVNVSIFDHPNHPHNKHNHTHVHPTKEEVPTTTDEVTEESVKKEPEMAPEEEMIALERKVRSADEVASSFSGNNLVSKASTTKTATSMMIAFNALYFKGSWKTPFVTQPPEGTHSFYTSDADKIAVPMMHSEGTFNIGKVSALDSVAIDLPYEGGRYSLLLLLPNSRTGLKKLIADLSGYSLCELSKTLTPQHVEVCLPSFEVQTTTKPIRALEKFGVSHVFSKENADLSGITPVNGLFVKDMSQLVTLNVELTSSSTNFLTASSEAASTRGDGEKFIADRPFLFFVHDIVDHIIVVAGKITNPTVLADDKAEEI